LCSLYGAFALTRRDGVQRHLGIPPTWAAFVLIFSISVCVWCAVDWTQYILLHSAATIELDYDTPPFALPPRHGRTTRRRFIDWLPAWIGREVLALPIWLWAFWGGVGVTWRDRRFQVGMDMRVHEIDVGRMEGEEEKKRKRVMMLMKPKGKGAMPEDGAMRNSNGSPAGKKSKRGKLRRD
jgi:ceramide glucosyltransferase